MRLCQLVKRHGEGLPDGLAIHALRSRLAELSESADGNDPAAHETERAAIAKELAVQEANEDPRAHARQPVAEGAQRSVEMPAAEAN